MLTLERAASNCPTANSTNLGQPLHEHRTRPFDMVLESSDMTCTKARLREPAEHRGTHGPCKNSERCPTWGLQYCSPLDGRPASTIH